MAMVIVCTQEYNGFQTQIIEVLSLIGTIDKSSEYQDVIGNMTDSFELNNYTLPTILPAESQNNQSTQNNVPQNIPDWIRNNAKWWAEDSISDADFIKGLQYLVQNGIVTVQSGEGVRC
jgi:hypothetical protein